MCTIKQHCDEEYYMGKYLWDKYMLEDTGYNSNLEKNWETHVYIQICKV